MCRVDGGGVTKKVLSMLTLNAKRLLRPVQLTVLCWLVSSSQSILKTYVSWWVDVMREDSFEYEAWRSRLWMVSLEGLETKAVLHEVRFLCR